MATWKHPPKPRRRFPAAIFSIAASLAIWLLLAVAYLTNVFIFGG